jgi:aspartyl protease family protein
MAFTRFFIATLLVGAAVGWFVPDLSHGGSPRAAASIVTEADRAEIVRQDSWEPGEVVLQRARDGHFYAEVAVGSGSVMMLVDTGASIVALTGNDASMMGVDWNPGDVRPIARGASGDVYGVPVMLERIQVGELEAQGVPAVVVPEGLDVSLLGQSFLSKMNGVEIRRDGMIIRD